MVFLHLPLVGADQKQIRLLLLALTVTGPMIALRPRPLLLLPLPPVLVTAPTLTSHPNCL